MPLKDHLNKLEYFCAIAELGSLRKASEAVHIGQPRLTKVIQELEDSLNVGLVVRSSSGITLTKEGRILLEQSRKILESINELELTLKSEDQNLSGEIRLGAYDSIARYFISGFIKFMSMAAPKIKINILTGRSQALMEKVSNHDLDVAILVSPENGDKRVQFQKLYSDQFSLYSAPMMNESFRSHLIYLPLEINDIEKSMRKFRFHQSIVCEGFETVRALAEQGVGVALLPTRVAKESVLSKKLIPFKHPAIRQATFDPHDIVLCSHKDQNKAAIDFTIDELKRYFQLWKP